MKYSMKVLALLLVVCMLIPMLPVAVKAEEYGQYQEEFIQYQQSPADTGAKILDYKAFLEGMKLLESYAVEFAAENPGKDPAGLAIRFVRTGAEAYNTNLIHNMTGYEDTDFAEYVRSREDAHNAANSSKINVTGLKNIEALTLPNGDPADMGRLFSVMDALYTNGCNSAQADVAGWAADLVDLLDLADEKGISGDLEDMADELRTEYFMKDSASFSATDCYADLDGYYLVRELTRKGYESGALSSLMEDYFVQGLTEQQRAAYFLQHRLNGLSNRSDIREAVFGGYTGNQTVASLESGRSFAAADLGDLRKASCYAFADYLCKLAGDFSDRSDRDYVSILTSEKTTLAPGIVQEICTGKTSDDRQLAYYLTTADITSEYVNVYVNYKDNDPTKGWGMQSVRLQAEAAQARHSNPESEYYIPNYDIIAAVNGAGYNMTTGEPAGLLVMEGVEYHAPDGIDHGGYGFFGILKDGSAIIASTEEYKELKAQGLVMEGIDNFGTTLVKDGKIATDHSDSHINNRASRTAVGITKTGKVVLLVVDGRQEPVSCGGSMLEIAQIMLDAGCVDAINLDGGGSTTYLAKKAGEKELGLVNRPSDGFERSVSTSLVVVSTMPSATALDRAVINSDVDYLTVGAKVNMTATGFNAAGAETQIPAGAVWKVSNSAVASISADGVLTGVKTGKVDVNLVVNNRVVGTKTMQVVVPDAVYFARKTMNAVLGKAVELPVAAQYAGKAVATHAGDFTFTLSNAAAGSVKGLVFTGKEGTTVKNVVVTAALAKNSGATATMTLALGTPAFDFDQATGGSRRLAWLRTVSNANTSDRMTYMAVDTKAPMVTTYTIGLDISEIPVSAQQKTQIAGILGKDAKDVFLLQLAEYVTEKTYIQIKLGFDSNLAVDISGIKVTGDYFTLADKNLNAANNELTLTLNWKKQTAAVDPETANVIVTLEGIKATPKDGANWDSKDRLALTNSGEMTYGIYFRSDALYAHGQSNPNGQIKPLNDAAGKGAYITGDGGDFSDEYALVNSAKNGWFYEEGGYAYYANGVRYTGVRKVGNFYYDFGENGINKGQTRYSGLFLENGIRYCAVDGVLTSGWYTEGDDHYYFDTNGAGQHGKLVLDEVELIFDNGLQTGGHTGFIKKSDGHTYHYENGRMTRGWRELNGNLYHFNTDTGIMTTGTHVIPDEEAAAKGAYYDFAEDGKTLWGYFNGFGYYYWAGQPRRDTWVKSGADSDRSAWYRTNGNGHFVTDATGKETFKLTIDGKTYTAVRIECEGVVYTFDNSNGKLLLGDFVHEGRKSYYYWAGNPVNSGWFELDGKTYYAYKDGHLAVGSNTIEGKTYMFGSQGALVKSGTIMTAEVAKDNKQMVVRITGANANIEKVRVAVWSLTVGQDKSLKWFDMEKKDNVWQVPVALCQFGTDAADTYEMHAYAIAPKDAFLINTTVDVTAGRAHTFDDNVDGTCNGCGIHREEVETRKVVHMFRMYNPNTGEHFYTGSTEERDNLIGHGWQYEGVGFTFPANTGDPVYRLFHEPTGEHLYTMDKAEKEKLEAEGWNYEGIAFNSAYDTEAVQHRLHNPNATVGAYHFTFSEEEKQNLINAGWEYQGIGWYSCWK